jgi:hypothetical protein
MPIADLMLLKLPIKLPVTRRAAVTNLDCPSSEKLFNVTADATASRPQLRVRKAI